MSILSLASCFPTFSLLLISFVNLIELILFCFVWFGLVWLNFSGMTPFVCAAQHGHDRIVDYLCFNNQQKPNLYATGRLSFKIIFIPCFVVDSIVKSDEFFQTCFFFKMKIQ
jgi:hypothetical protein